jgi:hypothetical protein
MSSHTDKNRTWAETIEGDIRQMENARDLLPVRQPNGALSNGGTAHD